MPKSYKPSVRLYTLIDLGSVTNLSTLPPADGEEEWDLEVGDLDQDQQNAGKDLPMWPRQAQGATGD